MKVMVAGWAFSLTIHSSLIREFVAFFKIDEDLAFSAGRASLKKGVFKKVCH
jgi:hypothetical protein